MAPARHPRWFWIPLRVLLITFLGTLLGFALSLLLGIAGIILTARLHGASPNMTIAYRGIALPSAIVVGAIVLVSTIVLELRHYRQTRALAQIERSSSTPNYAKHSPGI